MVTFSVISLSILGVFYALGYRAKIECPTETKFNFKFLKCEIDYHKTGGLRVYLSSDGVVSVNEREKDGKTLLFNGLKEGFYTVEINLDGALKREKKIFVESGELLENNFQTFFRENIDSQKRILDGGNKVLISEINEVDFVSKDSFFISSENSLTVFSKSGKEIFGKSFEDPFRVFHSKDSLLVLEVRESASECRFYSLTSDNSDSMKFSKIGESDYSQGSCKTVFYDVGVNERKINVLLGHEIFVANLEDEYIRRPLTEERFEIQIEKPEEINQLSQVELHGKKMSASKNSFSFWGGENFINVFTNSFSVRVSDGRSDEVIFRSENQILDSALDYNYEFVIIVTTSGDLFAASVDGEEVYKLRIKNDKPCKKIFVLKDNENLGCLAENDEGEVELFVYDLFFT